MVSEAEMPKFNAAKQALRDSKIPYTGFGTDRMNGSLLITFESQEIADKYVPIVEDLINVPFYVEIQGMDQVAISCASVDSDCADLSGGIGIKTQYSSASAM